MDQSTGDVTGDATGDFSVKLNTLNDHLAPCDIIGQVKQLFAVPPVILITLFA